jgi:hypothetical protein
MVTFVWALIAKVLGFHSDRIASGQIFNTLIIVPSFFAYVFSIIEKSRTRYQGHITFKQGFVSGMMLTLFVTILGPLTPLFSVMISPDFFNNAIQFVVSNKTMTEAEAVEFFNLTSFIIQGIIAAPVFGLVLSAVATPVARRFSGRMNSSLSNTN